MHPRQSLPTPASIARTIDLAGFLVFYAPHRHKQCVRVLRIEDDVIDHVIIAISEMGKPRPVAAAVGGLENRARTGA
jgi:hypothetical protein